MATPPSAAPSTAPSPRPTSAHPSPLPTRRPSASSADPPHEPSPEPTDLPYTSPSPRPTRAPSAEPSPEPSPEPTPAPTFGSATAKDAVSGRNVTLRGDFFLDPGGSLAGGVPSIALAPGSFGSTRGGFFAGYLNFPAAPTAHTLAAWVRITDPDLSIGGGVGVGTRTEAGLLDQAEGLVWATGTTDAGGSFAGWGVSTATTSYPPKVPGVANAWTFVAAAFSSGGCTIYQDGRLALNVTRAPASLPQPWAGPFAYADSTSVLVIGAYYLTPILTLNP